MSIIVTVPSDGRVMETFSEVSLKEISFKRFSSTEVGLFLFITYKEEEEDVLMNIFRDFFPNLFVDLQSLV